MRLVPALLVLGAAAAIAVVLLHRARRPRLELAGLVPRDTTMYVEVSSVHAAIAALSRMRFVDASQLEGAATERATVGAVAAAFDLEPGDARALIERIDAIALAARPDATSPDSALLVRFTRTAAVEAWLASKRLSPSGVVGRTGRTYTLRARELPPVVVADLGAVERALSRLHADGLEHTLAWFADEKLVVLGAAALVADVASVLDETAPSLQASPHFASIAERADGGAQMIAVVDDAVAGGLLGTQRRDALGFGGTLVAGLDVTDAGVRIEVHGPRSAVAGAVKASTVDLDLARDLPAETLAYVASSASARQAVAGEAMISAALSHEDEQLAAGVARGLAMLEQQTGIGGRSLFGELGDGGVLGLLASPDYPHDARERVAAVAQHLAAVHLVRVDDAAAEAALARLRQRIAGAPMAAAWRIHGDARSLFVDPAATEGHPSVRARVHNGRLFVGVGGAVLLDRAMSSFESGHSSLRTDAAHERAVAELGGARLDRELLLWIDSGRLATALLQADPGLRAAADDMGLRLAALRLGGPDRMTTALAYGCGEHGCRVATINAPAMFPLGAAARRLARPWLEQLVPAPVADETSIADCDEVLARAEAYGAALGAEDRALVTELTQQSRDSWAVLARGEARPKLAGACHAALDLLGARR
jgi:hypothetical protein